MRATVSRDRPGAINQAGVALTGSQGTKWAADQDSVILGVCLFERESGHER